MKDTRQPLSVSTEPFVPTARPYFGSFAIDLGLLAVLIGVVGFVVWSFGGSGDFFGVGLALFVIAGVTGRSYMAWHEVLSAKRFSGWQKPIRVMFAPQAMAIEDDESILFGGTYSDLKGARRSGYGLIVILPDGVRVAIPSDSFSSEHEYDLVEHHLRGHLREPIEGGPVD